MEENLLYIVGLIVTFWSGLLCKSYLPAYFNKKGENLATKEDIGKITKEIESVKFELAKISRIDEAKYKLKHDAYLEALAFIDAEFSHTLKCPDKTNPTPQYSTAEKARSVHNNLILASDSETVVKLFLKIVFDKSNEEGAKTDLLNNFRNLIREELGFGEYLDLNRDQAWIALIASEKPSS